MNRDDNNLAWFLVALALFYWWVSSSGPSVRPDQPTKLTLVYEKNQRPPSPSLLEALRESGGQPIERDVVNPDEEPPVQYRLALEAAGDDLPALVVQSGEKILEVIRNPTVEDVKLATIR